MKGTGSISGSRNSTSESSYNLGAKVTGFPFFLTAYDPSDLPGGSLDPMGFERGYLFLADKILPGLTNVADRPRYFSVICAGAFLADVAQLDPPRHQYQARLECILRFERFWALANVLATQKAADTGELSDSGIRGVTYARDEVESLIRKGVARTTADYKMLSRQVPYGVIGIYGAVADGMRLIDRKTFTLTPDLGERLAEGFLDETEIPQVLKKAICDGEDVPIRSLTEWGKRAHVSGPSVPVEVHCFHDVLNQNPVRARMAAALAANPFQDSGDNELRRLSRILPGLQSEPSNRDLAEAVRAILAYEECYRLTQLGFLEDLVAASGNISDPNSARFAFYDATRLRDQQFVALVSGVHGSKDKQTRERVFAGFNTPLLPEVLICTSVGQEGIDLHRHCRHVVHFDLAWNPAVMEQRTGRTRPAGPGDAGILLQLRRADREGVEPQPIDPDPFSGSPRGSAHIFDRRTHDEPAGF